MENPFRNLPSVNQLLESPPLRKLVERANHNVVVNGVRSFLDQFRQQIADRVGDFEIPSPAEMAERIATWLADERKSMLRPVINGTGIILHTGLGRAPLSPAAVQEIERIASGYASVEIDLRTGLRGQRAGIVKRLLIELTGAEDVAVANNNAAATMLSLAALAQGREVIVSRGHLIEIGGSYRLPAVMQMSGCILKEVGTTNKTHLRDYENAITENTAAILKVHPSNFQVVGFTETPSLDELVQLAHRKNLPLIDDIGSGALLDFSKYGLEDEPTAKASIEAGADVVLFSGDKLMGGPQCGLIIGKERYVQKVIKHPLMRAMRVGKLTLAALTATLELYRNEALAEQHIPLLAMLSTPAANLELRAKRICGQIAHLGVLKNAEAIPEHSMLGGGSVPGQTLPTWCVAIEPANLSLDRLANSLRHQTPAILGRVHKERFLLDLRTIDPKFDGAIVSGFEALSKESNS